MHGTKKNTKYEHVPRKTVFFYNVLDFSLPFV